MANAIEASGLGLLLGGRTVLQDVDLTVKHGEVFGVLGPNGAGKTSTVRVLAGLLQADRGSARVLGLDPSRREEGHEIRRRVGVLTESPALYERLTGRENLAFFAALNELTGDAVQRALTAVGLEGRADEPVGGYSKGMQQRLAIARAILHDPELLFLDEPTAGLDPASAARIADLIGQLRAEGRTVFLATHHLLDAERQCDRFAFYAAGRVVAQGTRPELERLAGLAPRVEVRFAGEVPAPPEGVEATPDGWVAPMPDVTATPALVAAAVASGRVMAVTPRSASVEDLYFALVEAR